MFVVLFVFLVFRYHGVNLICNFLSKKGAGPNSGLNIGTILYKHFMITEITLKLVFHVCVMVFIIMLKFFVSTLRFP